jgi:hypothetical protein
MSNSLRISLLILALLAGLLLAWGVVEAAPALKGSSDARETSTLTTPTPLPNQPAVVSPDISSIQSPTASCFLPQANTGACFITWSYLSVDADPNYIITMTVSIDDKAVARFNGFFQTSMYVPPELLVFRVACGIPGSGGDAKWGANHSYTLRARDSAGLAAANYGTITCPADIVRRYLPILNK